MISGKVKEQEDKSLNENDSCKHCGLDIPEYRKILKINSEFCCNGCASVYNFLKSNNLDYYYRLKEDFSDASIPAIEPETKKDLEWFDNPDFLESHVFKSSEEGRSISTIELFLEGIHCPACVWLLEKTPQIFNGLRSLRVDISRSIAELTYFSDEVSLSRIASKLTKLGYRPHPYRGHNFSKIRKKAEKSLLLSLGVAGACAGNIMIVSVCLYAGLFSSEDVQYENYFRWVAFLLSIPAVFWSGRIFYQRAITALKIRQIHLDVPISLGIIGAFSGSVVNTLRGSGEIYFDSVASIIFLLLISRFLQFRAQHRAQEKTELIFSLLPSYVHLFSGDEVKEVLLDELCTDDIIQVLAGEVVPVDGIIQEGSSLIDSSVLTGESQPITVNENSAVFAGMKNISSSLKVKVKSTGELTRIGRLAKLASDLQKSKPPVLHLVDKLSKWFVLLVLTLSFVAFYLGSLESFEEGFARLIALLIISCPCALGMATPLSLSVAVGNAARCGIHFRNTTSIEKIYNISKFIFDKTGTLTKGSFKIQSVWGDENYLPFVYALEKHSSHVIARSIVDNLKSFSSDHLIVENAEEIPSRGIKGRVSGHDIIIGNEGFILANDVLIPSEGAAEIQRITEQLCTPIYVAVNLEIVLILSLGDPLREGVFDVICELKKHNEVYILSGDNEEVVKNLALKLDISKEKAFGDMSPEDKVSKIEEISQDGMSVFFGDGSNDAAALAASSVGVAMHGGAEASFLVADCFFSRPDIRLVERLRKGSTNSMRVVYTALASSFLFNFFGCSMAILGYISPLFAAILMPVSSLIVVVLSFSQKSFLR